MTGSALCFSSPRRRESMQFYQHLLRCCRIIMRRTAFIFFIITLIFAPLAFGTAEQWSMATVQLLVCCSAFCLIFSLKNKKTPLLAPPGMLPLVLLVLWMFFQFIPLPAVIVQQSRPQYTIYISLFTKFSAGTSGFPLPSTKRPLSSSVCELHPMPCFTFSRYKF